MLFIINFTTLKKTFYACYHCSLFLFYSFFSLQWLSRMGATSRPRCWRAFASSLRRHPHREAPSWTRDSREMLCPQRNRQRPRKVLASRNGVVSPCAASENLGRIENDTRARRANREHVSDVRLFRRGRKGESGKPTGVHKVPRVHTRRPRKRRRALSLHDEVYQYLHLISLLVGSFIFSFLSPLSECGKRWNHPAA